MRTKTLAMAAAFALLTFLPPGLAGEDAIPDKLEKMLEMALESNPDLALAEARVKEAQAELNQTRLKVAQQVATLYHDRTRLRKLKRELTADVARLESLAESGMMGPEESRDAVLGLADADAKLARNEAEIRYVLGLRSTIMVTFSHETTGRSTADSGQRRRPSLPRPELDPAEFPYLGNRIEVSWGGWTVPKILQALQVAAEDKVAFLLGPDLMASKEAEELLVPLHLPEPVRIVAAMQAIVDYLRESRLCFAFTEYGVVLVRRETAETMPVPTIPGDVPLYSDRR